MASYSLKELKEKSTEEMIDISNAKWDFSKEEKFAIKWLEKNGYSGRIIKQYVSKTIFEITKDGITDKFELPQGIVFKNIKGYMEQYRQNWDLLCELHRLKGEAKQRSVDNMTIAEAQSIPKGMDFEEYEKLLNDKQKLEKQIAKASDTIQSEIDSLEVLADEVGSERYNKHLQTKQKAEAKRENAQEKLQTIMERIR